MYNGNGVAESHMDIVAVCFHGKFLGINATAS